MSDVSEATHHSVQREEHRLLQLAVEKSGTGHSRAHRTAAAAASKRKKSPESSNSDNAASGSDEEDEADKPKPKKKELRESGSDLTSKKAEALFDEETQVSSGKSGHVSS
jgi:hypothetical protein